MVGCSIMATIVVREAAGPEDLNAVRRLMQDYGDHLANNPSGAANICLAGYREELDRLPEGYDVLLLALVDGEPAGCVAVRTLQREERACEMKRLWTKREFRGLGLGRRLAEEAIGWAKRMGFAAMYLDTVPTAMPEANRLYDALGFLPVERYNQNPISDVVFFRRSLLES
jgi:GNAT superfamily N-acetyltransferase